MKLYNTLHKKITAVKPLRGKALRIYSCGPTVYDHAHIGNLSAYIFADTLRRAASLAGFTTTHAMNYTDVDDKTIRRSAERYGDLPPEAALKKLTDLYIKVFLSDMHAIGNDVAALQFIRATDTILDMQALITELYRHKFAYLSDDGVYFSIEAYRKAGKTYGQLQEITVGNTSAARIQNDEYDKESVHDFALWKTQKPGEPAWPFALDGQQLAGRPGWHIECSAMSKKLLGQPFDIHTGGVDLIFPHHENEIAQSTAAEKNPVMASIFAHNEHILVNGKKMSKSAQNFYTLSDVIEKQFDPLAFRLLVLQAHYRSQVNFTWESLQAAQNRLTGLRAFADLRFQPTDGGSTVDFAGAERQKLIDPLLNDLRTPELLEALARTEATVSPLGVSDQQLPGFMKYLETIDAALGLGLLASKDITTAQKKLLQARQTARDAKDWSGADSLRDTLAAHKIGVRDTAQGQIWSRL